MLVTTWPLVTFVQIWAGWEKSEYAGTPSPRALSLKRPSDHEGLLHREARNAKVFVNKGPALFVEGFPFGGRCRSDTTGDRRHDKPRNRHRYRCEQTYTGHDRSLVATESATGSLEDPPSGIHAFARMRQSPRVTRVWCPLNTMDESSAHWTGGVDSSVAPIFRQRPKEGHRLQGDCGYERRRLRALDQPRDLRLQRQRPVVERNMTSRRPLSTAGGVSDVKARRRPREPLPLRGSGCLIHPHHSIVPGSCAGGAGLFGTPSPSSPPMTPSQAWPLVVRSFLVLDLGNADGSRGR